jgi:hypothetical protein
MKDNILYYDSKTNEEKSIQIETRFLTAALRTNIIRHDNEVQMEYKRLQKELGLNDENKPDENALKIKGYAEKLKKQNPEIDEQELNRQISQYSLELLNDISEESLKQNSEKLELTYKNNDKWNIKFFQLIVNTEKLEGKDKDLISSKCNSEFWKNTDIEKVAEINVSFRSRYKI